MYLAKENGVSAVNTDAVIRVDPNGKIVADDDHTVKRDRRNVIRRIRRALRKGGMDLHYFEGDYFPVPVRYYLTINVEQFARKSGATQTIGYCDFCHKLAWHKFEGVLACDTCAVEVRR